MRRDPTAQTRPERGPDPTAGPPAATRRLETGVLVLLLVLAVVWSVGEQRREIYPSVQLPAFGAVPAPNPAGAAEFRFVVGHGGETSEFAISELLHDAPASAWTSLLRSMQQHQSDPEMHAWLLGRAALIVEGCADRAGVTTVSSTSEVSVIIDVAGPACR